MVLGHCVDAEHADLGHFLARPWLKREVEWHIAHTEHNDLFAMVHDLQPIIRTDAPPVFRDVVACLLVYLSHSTHHRVLRLVDLPSWEGPALAMPTPHHKHPLHVVRQQDRTTHWN